MFDFQIKGEICLDHFLWAQQRIRMEMPFPMVWHRLVRDYDIWEKDFANLDFAWLVRASDLL